MYNLDAQNYPAPGAPEPRWYSTDFSSICSMCFDSLTAADTDYFRTLDKQRRAQLEQQKGTNGPINY